MRREPIDGQPVFTVKLLHHILLKIVGSRRYSQPDADALAKLVTRLEAIAEWYRTDQILASSDTAKRKTSAALRKAREALAELRVEEARFLDLAENNLAMSPGSSYAAANVRCKRSDIDQLDQLAECIAGYERSPLLLENRSNIDRWSQYGHELREAFVEAMRSTNSKFDPGIGHNGPVARFIVAVAPLLSGEMPTADSVATKLKSMRASG